MLGELLKVGDKVRIDIEAESRRWGYNPCEDGTIAELVGFDEMYRGHVNNFGLKPGVYNNLSWPLLKFADGRTDSIWSGRVKLVDVEEAKRRSAELREANDNDARPWKQVEAQQFLRELPEVPFWEGDLVHSYRDDKNYVIISIDWYHLNTTCSDGITPYPVYQISDSFSAGWHTAARESGLRLVSRGNIWKFYHKEPMVFERLESEVELHMQIGQYEEVRNPATGNYAWKKNEVLDAIAAGIAHGFSMPRALFSGQARPMAVLFHDVELGKRVAQHTLSGFNHEHPEHSWYYEETENKL